MSTSPYHRKIAFLTVLFLLAVFIIFTRMPADQIGGGMIQSPREGFYPPNFSSELMAGGVLDQKTLEGKVIVLNFWASWCPPCKAEMPALQAASIEFANQDVVILGVNATSQDSLADATQFIKENGITFPILLDSNGQINADFQVNSLPTTFFIGQDGKIKQIIVGGPISETSLRTQIEALIGGY
ncbi:MAG TPA: TlpA disulfide reductase family protein [Anaerolineales bacterium]|nr:TlpA disulfide reductase family protein [Anaerolineales bacterium]